jgi:integrase
MRSTPLDPLLDQARKHWLAALWLILITTGLRRGEALAIAWSDLDMTSGVLRVRRTLQRIKGQLVFGEPKTPRSRRTLTLTAVCLNALRQHRTITAEQASAIYDPLPHQPGDLIFTTRTGRAIDPRSVNRALASLCRRAGIDPARVHDLRHTAASLLLADGASPREIMELLGHGITMNIYAHVLDASKRALANRMDELFTGDRDDRCHPEMSEGVPMISTPLLASVGTTGLEPAPP